ncbi:MAG: diphthine synthase [Chaenotheca gracillima]|nr:MAG: diphthine synthase [Chaenotheca gracillima]
MSSGNTFSNASTGDKPADPYKAKNVDEASLKEKVEDLTSFVEACKFGMMTTRQGDSGLLVSRAMALAGKEGGGVDLLFHTNTESGKTNDLMSDPKINISFINSSGEWASISGEASVVTDREMVRKYYSPALKAWVGDLGDGTHDGGPEDPRIAVIKVSAITATYAISRRTAVGRTVELAKGVVTGDAPSVNKLREISTEELETYKTLLG